MILKSCSVWLDMVGVVLCNEVKFDGRFSSVEPLKTQQPGRKGAYKWNHRALQNWIMSQADPAGFLATVMAG